MSRLKQYINVFRNMGMRYILFRSSYELMRRTGWLKRKFPITPVLKTYIRLDTWRSQAKPFFFESREDIAQLTLSADERNALKADAERILSGGIKFFSATWYELGKDYDWVTNPDTGYRYNTNLHWTLIQDFSKTAGDIKYVWEKSRFAYLYTIIRYDQHFDTDHSEWVFSQVLDWINRNPINQGPNYKCSQEMSLRVLNWIFALYYYRNSKALTPQVFEQIQHVIYWHYHHIYHNIHFSRIAVRNNHAITETLALYLIGLLFPAYPNATQWKRKGRKWFEQEVAYQVYPDGTFLQFSMNYHRVVVQLLTWGIILAERNGEKLAGVVYDRAHESLQFLQTCMDEQTGWLPNYGANDGALFFPLSQAHFRNYKPQLAALQLALGITGNGNAQVYEDLSWLGLKPQLALSHIPGGAYAFEKGGYYVLRHQQALTFIRCGKHKDRPSHADNLHLDIWVNGKNYLCDAGSYKYNTNPETIRYFAGTASHNTVMIGDADQMQKGPRFIWYNWSQSVNAGWTENPDAYVFDGSIQAFAHIAPGIIHQRRVTVSKSAHTWLIEDEISGSPAGPYIQLWHIPVDLNGQVIIAPLSDAEMLTGSGYTSVLYGEKMPVTEIKIISNTPHIRTRITITP